MLAAIDPRFIGYTIPEVETERDQRLKELDRNSSFILLAAIEAGFRVDFLVRCYSRYKDDLSRRFQDILKQRDDNISNISLEKDILDSWKELVPQSKPLISQVKAAFRYRHWLAHGCYWTPKLGRNYDFASIYLLAQGIGQAIDLLSPG
ncbi:MAG: hypothetical protein ABSH38_08035 [Verrucomicrobiota bacterium]